MHKVAGLFLLNKNSFEMADFISEMKLALFCKKTSPNVDFSKFRITDKKYDFEI